MPRKQNLYPDSPRVAVGAVVFKDNRVLLVRRAQPPSQNIWAIPGGSVEIGETLQAAAEREILEETGVKIRAGEPVFTFDYIDRDKAGRIRFHYIIVNLMADYISGEPHAGDDAADARWVSSGAIGGMTVSKMTRRLLIPVLVLKRNKIHVDTAVRPSTGAVDIKFDFYATVSSSARFGFVGRYGILRPHSDGLHPGRTHTFAHQIAFDGIRPELGNTDIVTVAPG